MRAPPDLHMMACPPKFRSLGDFHHYYAERKRAPYLTIVIGGNHESSGFLWECYHGGWLAPDIYFLGFAGCLLVDGWLRIAGASGIWKQHDFAKGHFETVPYDNSTIRSVYHIRQYDVARLLQLKNQGPPVDIFLSHDWPLGIEQYGDTAALLREKPFFRQEVEENRLGSPPLHALLTTLQPRFWFSAHLHVKFAALVHHDGRKTTVRKRRRAAPEAEPGAVTNPDEIALDDDDDDDDDEDEGEGAKTERESVNPEEIQLDDDDSDHGGLNDATDGPKSEEKGCLDGCGGARPEQHTTDNGARVVEQGSSRADGYLTGLDGSASEKSTSTTRFLALGKPGFGRDFLQVIDVEPTSPQSTAPSSTETNAAELPSPLPNRPSLHFDPHWLAIVRAFSPYLSLTVQPKPFPPVSTHDVMVADALAWVKQNVGTGGTGLVSVDSVQTFSRTAPATGEGPEDGLPGWYTNPQSEALSRLLGIDNQINPMPAEFKQAAERARLHELARVKAEALRMIVDDADEVVARQGDEEPPETIEEAVTKAAVDGAVAASNPDELVVDDDDDDDDDDNN